MKEQAIPSGVSAYLYPERALEDVVKAWQDSAVDIIGESDFEKIRDTEYRRCQDAWIAYRGGETAARHFIMKNYAEKPTKYQERLIRAHNVQVVRPVVEFFTGALYGKHPERQYWIGPEPVSNPELARMWLKHFRDPENEPEPDLSADETSRELNAWFKYYLRENGEVLKAQERMRYRMIEGITGTRIRLNQEGTVTEPGEIAGLLSEPWHRWDAIPIFDPNDRLKIVGVMEYHKGGRPSEWILHTAERWTYVTPDLSKDLGGGMDQPTGMLPWVFFGDGESTVTDAVEDQKYAINAANVEEVILRAQGFAVLAITGRIKNALKKSPQGEEGTPIGPLDALLLDEGASAEFLVPNAPLADHRESRLQHLQKALAGHNLPKDFFADTSGTAERAMAKLLGMIPSEMRRVAFAAECEVFERQKAHVEARYVSEYAPELDAPQFDPTSKAEEFGFGITFTRSFIPTDDAEREERDRQRYLAGTMLVEEYLMRRPENADLDPKQIAMKAHELEQEKTRAFDSMLSAEPLPFSDGPTADSPDEPEIKDDPGAATGDAAKVGAVTDAVDFQALSLLMERAGRIGDVAIVNVARERIAQALGADVESMTLEKMIAAKNAAEGKTPAPADAAQPTEQPGEPGPLPLNEE